MTKLRCMAAILCAALAMPLAAQTPAAAAVDGVAVTIFDVPAVTVNRPGRFVAAASLREKPSASASIVEYWATATQKEPELRVPAGTSVPVVARTADKQKVGDLTDYWYRVELATAKQGAVQAWAYGGSLDLEAAWVAGSAGFGHGLAIQRDGSLRAWGYNEYGQLGDGTTESRLSPVRVGAARDWAWVHTLMFDTVVVKRGGTLWSWGANPPGAVGEERGTEEMRPMPEQVGTDTDWVSAVAGSAHYLAVKRDGTLWAWGESHEGLLGIDNWGNNVSEPTQAHVPGTGGR